MPDRLNACRGLATALCAAFAVIVSFSSARAASHEQIIEACKQAHMEELRACVRGKVGNPRSAIGPELEKARQACGGAIVRPCVLREEQKQAAGVAAPAAPKDASAAPDAPLEIRTSFVAPPRTIADITAILDSEKPDEAQIAKRKATADAAPAKGLSGPNLAQFLFDRAAARTLLARNKEALADGLQALDIAKHGMDLRFLARTRRLVAMQYRATGNPRDAIAVLQQQVGEGDAPGRRGTIISSLRSIAQILISLGDINGASGYVNRAQAMVSEARGSPNPKWRAAYPIYGHNWEADADAARGLIFEARGQYADAEMAYRRAEAFEQASVKDLPRYDPPVPPREQFIAAANGYLLSVARNEMKQGKLSAGEADARRALLGILKVQGKYAPTTPNFVIGLAGILVEQGRYKEAEQLGRSALDVQRTIGIADEAPLSAAILSSLGNILVLQRNMKEASTIYAQLDKAMAQWPQQQREVFELNGSRIAALYASGQVEAGIAAANALVKQQTARTGATSFDTAAAHGTLAIGYARAGRDTDAIREFKTAIPVLMAASRENADEDDPTVIAARSARLQRIVESYIGVLARGVANPNAKSNDIAVETFALTDAIRGRSVQKALADASARMVAKDSALAEVVRNEQNLGKQISAALGTLNNLLALPSDQRDEQTVRATSAAIEKLRADRKTAQQDIKRRFPSYADLIDSKPPSVDEIKNALRPGEALLSYYFGQNASFVWAVPKDGDVAFASVPATAAELEAKVRRLRQALEPQVSMVSEIPPFDVALGYELYMLLLKPIEAAWQPAKSLIVATNGALGELPLSLLPTAPARIDPAAKPLFANYRTVAWLARSHAVTVVPSASAIVTLRRLPRGSPARDKLIGFGDPYFNADQAAEAEREQAGPMIVASAAGANADAENVTRGIPLRLRASPHTEENDAATLAILPRLPDTRFELISVAEALETDPAKALFLGKAANEQNVETLDLAHYRIVAFSTHGLVPGDLDGLTQPALALTAPEVAGVKGDGLLTMEKILALKLDADWVVLSACNTAAGAGAGAEAASGLGSAFFYAGTRALLVTNWSVHSASARELMTDLFRRQRADPALTRGEALRQAMMALLDGAGAVDSSGRTIYSYAHPLFWAPYSVIGDGGGM
ncbi:MAG: CHAT domain-containing protein [Betaproteobacteria bacterium]